MNLTLKCRPAMTRQFDVLCADMDLSRAGVIRLGVGLLRAVAEEMRGKGGDLIVRSPDGGETILVMPELAVYAPAPEEVRDGE